MSKTEPVLFLMTLVLVTTWLQWRSWRQREAPPTLPVSQQSITSDLSNLPPQLGPKEAPIVIEVSFNPRHAGPCDKGTIMFVRQLVEEYEGKVQARFHKAMEHPKGLQCAAQLTVNGKRRFKVKVGGREVEVQLHGIARPGDPMSEIVRQIVEQELERKNLALAR